ncbi:hypothetical protein BEP19_13160 [Ammoniphilus oxalaticus]|uniref:Polysaccharide biosynthesis protein CapD-like domain-containing protein n=1 Tax=Ammoniphilus oxalaticus TaxID=66863 RepID=A0A419SH72_9BACL|nr:nucleoside-diphosphate sugar epimerase/dehydratase [Ammoniphilus oxalaticus]RKD23161.1 hypothetical protein BEP19_13160 [Ammoniphilus oxalaticus]
MTYRQRLFLLAFVDSISIISGMALGNVIIKNSLPMNGFMLWVSAWILLLSHFGWSVRYKIYKKAWEYASVGELIAIVKCSLFSILFTAIAQLVLFSEVHFRLLIVSWMMYLLLFGGSRFGWRLFRDRYFKETTNRRRALIIGAGSAGTMVARQLLHNNDAQLLPIAFIDDCPSKQNLEILGLPVIGGVDQIKQKVAELQIENIVIAIPSLKKRELRVIFQACSGTAAKTKMIPMLEDIVMGKVSVSQFRDVRVEDLLGRDPVELYTNSISEYITGKTVLVTGAGGSIGSELCRQIMCFSPAQLVLLGHGENSIYTIEMELKDAHGSTGVQIHTEIADLQDRDKMMAIIAEYQPHVVYHAAAHKHVPLMERNPEEAVKNNMIGTLNIAEAASQYGVETFVMISTDKAVNPTSVMGASKRLAEMLIQRLDQVSPESRFVTVRFGNVLGSRGSVIPRFKKQIQTGGPVTVTHPEMVRYFMTIPEASRLVIQAGALAEGGEVFVLDMGEPVKIVDLAKNLIRLSGNSLDEIGIQFSGIRPGEKLFEELLQEDEIGDHQVHPKIYIGKTSTLLIEEIEELIQEYAQLDRGELRERLLKLANHKVEAKAAPELLSVGG